MASLTVMTLILVSLACRSTAEDKGLRLKSYSEDEVKGCYKHNQTLGVCFDVKKGSMKITKTTGEGIVHYLELGKDKLFYQILDQAFVANGPSLFYIPDHVSRVQAALRAYVKDISGTPEDGFAQQEALKSHYQAAMSELHYVPEVQLLERVSAALADNFTRLEILQPFHTLCFNLLKVSDVDIPSELKAAPDMEDDTADQHGREKRCTSLQNRKDINCRGMCGKMCSCWSWFCGDCCFHRGCYEHDLCCNYNFYSTYCLAPFIHGLKCSGYGGYPKCKPKKSWWK